MKLRKTLLLIGLCFPLLACNDLISSAKLPDELLKSCQRPAALPERGLTQAQVEEFWGLDRTNLKACKRRVDSIIKWVKDREAALK